MKRAFSSAVAASARAAGSRHACVIGWPIAHSRSPLIHGYWLKKYGIEGSYTKEAVRPEELAAFLSGLEQNGFAGCNVTVPHKEAALAAADVVDASAKAVGACNTLWLEGGKLHAANTDTYGYMTYLGLKAPGCIKGDVTVSVLGAGGAARGIVHGFLEAGVREVGVFNRSRDRAEALASTFGPRVKVFDWDDRSPASVEASVLVNTTTLGMKGAGDPTIDFAGINRDCVASDIVYVPLETKFLADAKRAGLRTVDGLGMLLHQAVPGFERWFGVWPEVTEELYQLIAADIGAGG